MWEFFYWGVTRDDKLTHSLPSILKITEKKQMGSSEVSVDEAIP